MKRSLLRSSGIRAQLLCACLVLFAYAAPSLAVGTWFDMQSDPLMGSISGDWTCPFPQPNGAVDRFDFSPFSTTTTNIVASSNSLAPTSSFFNWDNGYPRSSGLRVEVPTMARASGNGGYYDTGGLGNKAVIQAIYAVLLNRHTPYPHGMDIEARGSFLLDDLVPAMYSDSIMESVISQVSSATGISDGGEGTVEQLAAGLQIGSDYYLSCAPGAQYGRVSSQIFTSSDFMGNIDIGGFTSLIADGTIMILQTNKLVWNASKHAWNYGEDGIYLIKGITSSNVRGSSSFTYTLYDVATGTSKVVTPSNQAIRNIWTTGAISGSHTVAILDDGDPDYAEVIVSFAGMDPLFNFY